MKSALLKIWANSLPRLQRRLDVLERYEAASANRNASEALHAAAVGAAHTLAGILGTLGFPEGTTAAANIEAILTKQGPDAAKLQEDLGVLQGILRTRN